MNVSMPFAWLKMILLLVLVTAALLIPYFVQAATYTWDGGGATNNWSDCNNWSTNVCPTSADIAVFDGTSTKDATVDATFGGSVAGLQINSGYSGTVTLARSLTIGSSDFTLAAGTFAMGSNTLTLSSADFTMTGGTFSEGTGTVSSTGSSNTINVPTTETFYNFTNNKSVSAYVTTISSGDTIVITGTLTIEDGELNTGTIDIASGAQVVVNGVDGGTAVVQFAQTGDETITCTDGGVLPGIRINKSSGTLDFSCSTLIVHNGDFSLQSGTFSIGTSTLSVSSGDFTISGGTFDEGTGTVRMTGAINTINVPTTETFYNFTINKSNNSYYSTITSGDTIVVTNTFTITDGGVNTGTVDIASGASVVVEAGADGGTGIVQFAQTGDETITCTNGGYIPGLLVNKASGILNFSCTSFGVGSGGFSLQSGTFALGSNTLNFTGNMTISGGTFDEGTGTIRSTGSSHNTINILTTETFYNFTIDKNLASYITTITAGDTIVVTNSLTLTEGELDDGTVDLAAGAIVNLNGGDGGDAVIKFDETGDETITCTSGTLPGLLINKPSGTLDFGCSSLSVEGTFTLQSGTFALGSNTFSSTANNFTISGGTFDEGTGTLRFYGAGHITVNVPTTETFYNLTIDKTSAWQVNISSGDTLVVTGTLTLTDGSFNTGTTQAEGNVTVGSGFDGGSTALVFAGSSIQTLALGTAGSFNGDITVNKSGGAVELASALTVDASSQDLLIVEGVLDTSGFTLTESGTGTFVVQDGGTLRLQGGETVTVPTLNHGSTVEYDGSGTYTTLPIGSSYSNLSFSGSGTFSTSSALGVTGNFTHSAGTLTLSNTITLSGATSSTFTTSANTNLTGFTVNKTSATVTLAGTVLDVDGDLTLTAGTLDASASGCSSSSCNITLAGDWINTAGTFTARTGTVTLDGTSQSITGDTTFYNLSKSVAAADTLTFGGDDLQTITGTWTMAGASGQLLSLDSTASGTQWQIDPQGTRTISYLDVQDSNNTNATAISTGGFNITNSGNNTNWNFNSAPDAPTSLAPSNYVDGSYVTDNTPSLTFTTSDNDGDNVTYQIVIDDSADFGSPVVDYTSVSGAAGASSFTVGQAAGSGSYSTGSEGQTLSDGSYYWRVRASDAGGTGSYATANTGSVAFVLDTAAPTTGSVTIGTTSTSSISVSLAGASDAGSGLSATPYTWYEATGVAATGATTTTSWIRSSLTPNTQYTFTVGVTDAASNTATTTATSTYTLALAPTIPVADADSDTAVTFAWSGGTNPAGTEYYAENTTAGTNSGWITATSWTSSSLTAETAYQFSVKARNGNSIETSSATSSATTDPAPVVSGDEEEESGGGYFAGPSILNSVLPASSGKSLLIGPSRLYVGNMAIITIIARNHLGQNIGKGGASVTVAVTGANSAYPSVTDNGDGTYTARYVAAYSGKDTVVAYINGKRVINDTDGLSDGSLEIEVQTRSVATGDEPSSPADSGSEDIEFEEDVEEVQEADIPPTTETVEDVLPHSELFNLESGLTPSCQRAFSWNHNMKAKVYRQIGNGLETPVATINSRTTWYIDVDPITNQTLKYRFEFEGANDTAISFESSALDECNKSPLESLVIERDIDADGQMEQFIDGVFQDIDGSSVPLVANGEGVFVDTDGDNEPDTFWNPGVGTSPVVVAGDRLFITNSSITEITMYEKYEDSTYSVVLRFLANGQVALAAESEEVAEFMENNDTIIIGPGVFEVPIRYIAAGAVSVLAAGLGFVWWRRRKFYDF